MNTPETPPAVEPANEDVDRLAAYLRTCPEVAGGTGAIDLARRLLTENPPLPAPRVLTVEEASSVVIPEGPQPWQWSEPVTAIVADSLKWQRFGQPWEHYVAQSAIENLYRFGPFAIVQLPESALTPGGEG